MVRRWIDWVAEGTNCLPWALRQVHRYGGQLWIVIPSVNYPGPHFGWIAGEGHPACLPGEIYERAPIIAKKRWTPPLVHRGYIRLAGHLTVAHHCLGEDSLHHMDDGPACTGDEQEPTDGR